MNTNRKVITSLFALGLAAAVQTGDARELPENLKQFAEQQHQQIVVQGWEARKAISEDITVVMGKELKEARIAFMESQGRSILEQGERALASIKDDMKGVELAQYRPEPATRVSFTETQGQAIGTQGRVALETIRSELRLVALPDPAEWMRSSRTETADWPQVAAR